MNEATTEEEEENKITGAGGVGGSSIQYLRDTVRLQERERERGKKALDLSVGNGMHSFWFPLFSCLFVCGEEIS